MVQKKNSILGVLGLVKGIADSATSIIRERRSLKISSKRVSGLTILGLAVNDMQLKGLNWLNITLTAIGSLLLIAGIYEPQNQKEA
jgi:hypothetical protein